MTTPFLATITKTFTFDAAHHIPSLPDGHKCKRLHGHTYRVDLILCGLTDPETGFVMDYADVAAAWQPINDKLDHRCLNDIAGLEIPSTEHLARWIIRELKGSGFQEMPQLRRIRVYESSTTWCEVHVADAAQD